MMNSYVLLPDTTGSINMIGKPVPGCGVNPDMVSGKNTVSITTGPKCIGRIYIEGSLVKCPQDCDCGDDWFVLQLTDINGNKLDFVEYPTYDELPNGIKIINSDHKTFKYTFEALPVRVRARLDRTYLPDYEIIEKEQFINMRWKVDLGNIQQVVLNWN